MPGLLMGLLLVNLLAGVFTLIAIAVARPPWPEVGEIQVGLVLVILVLIVSPRIIGLFL